jgi:predicted flap endonuclease-1-like 5' DNA nuclease
MTFAEAVFWSIFWLVIAAILGGLIVWFMLRNRVKYLQGELKSLQKTSDNYRGNAEQKQKELDLEIRARDRKLEVAQTDFNALQAQLNEKDRALQIEVAERINLQNNFNAFKDEAAAFRASASASGSSQAEIDTLKAEIEDKDSALKMESQRRDELSANYAKLKTDCEQAQTKLKAEIKAKEEEIALLKAGVGSTKAETGEGDKKEQALARVREKAKSFDYSRIGVAMVEDKDDLKIIVGIGPFIEEKLHALGIYTFEQISKFTDADVEQVTEAIEFFPGRIQRDHWISQAAELWEKKKQGLPLE